jgi:hypothetical protein
VGERTGDPGAALALAYVAGRPQVTDEQLVGTLESALGRWSQGFTTFAPELQAARQSPEFASIEEVQGAELLRRPPPWPQKLTPAASKRLRALINPRPAP